MHAWETFEEGGLGYYHPPSQTVKNAPLRGIIAPMSEDTRPMPSLQSTQQTPVSPGGSPPEERQGLWRRLRWFLLAFILVVGAAAVAGYFSGVQARERARTEQSREQAARQFQLGIEDLEAGHYERARQRLEYVIDLDPGYPGVAERMAEVLLALNQPTARPTVAATATPNLAPVEDLFEEAQRALEAEEWTQAIQTLLALRAKDAGYQAVQVDGMMYQALRNRGVDRISNQGMLSEGMYDLARAQSFGPLDRDASNWKSWAELYLKANSYMGVDWAQAVSAWAQVYVVAPYLRNDAYMKYAISAQRYADLLMEAGEHCDAEDFYDESLLAWDNPTVYPTATDAWEECREDREEEREEEKKEQPTATPETGPPPTPTATPEGNGNGGDGNGGGG